MSNFQKNYVNNLSNYFGSKYADDLRLFQTINRFLNFNNHKIIEKGSKLLDLGSGTGSFVKVCEENKIKSIGLDFASNNLNFDKDKLPLQDNTFEFITMINLIEHLRDHKNIITEIKRVAKNNATLIICTPNFKYAYKNFYDDPTHCSPFTNVSLSKFLENHGFTYINIAPFLVDKSDFFWKFKYKFKLASLLPFTNHERIGSNLIPKFLRGKSTSMICTSLITK